MNRPLLRIVTPLTAGVLVALAGCAHHHKCCSPRTSFRLPLPPGPCCNGGTTSAYAPGGSVIVGAPSTPMPLPPPEPPPSYPNGVPPAMPPAVGSWQPGPNGVQPRVVESRPLPAPDSSGTRLLPPDQDGAKLSTPEVEETRKPILEKPQVPPTDTGEFPPDVPNFNPVYDKVSSGLRPFAGGFEWLKNRGYKTVLHLRGPGEDEAADRAEVERLGMKYLSLEVGPRTLNAELVKAFSKVVQEKDAQPLFVYDRKGLPAGALWYLHFRLTDNMPEAQARVKAMRLGLKEETTGDSADLWLAINQILRGI
jgi:protein tyrosine phosphatase (PTP) superfamily phosphohydrolase (DUF442 family)